MDEKLLASKYSAVLSNVKAELGTWEGKADALVILSSKMAEVRDEIDRNDLLDIRQKINDIKAQHERCNKLVKSCINWVDDAILIRLKDEELDNYSRNGKLFYPSTQQYTSMADRTAVNQFAMDSKDLDIFSNSLNKEFVMNYLDAHGELPPGVNTYQKTRLNVRTKP